MIAVAEQRVIEQVGKRGLGPEQAAFAVRPPISMREDLVDILRAGSPHPGVLENQAAVIHGESGVEGVGIYGQGEQAKCCSDQQVATRGGIGRGAPALCGDRWGAFSVPRFHETSDYQMVPATPRGVPLTSMNTNR